MALFICPAIGQLTGRARGTVDHLCLIIQHTSLSFLHSRCWIPRAASEGKHQYVSTFGVSAYISFAIVPLAKACHAHAGWKSCSYSKV